MVKEKDVIEEVIQCAVRYSIKWSKFKGRLLAENAQGWVELKKKDSSEGHASPAPWAFSHHYVMDIVGEESLVVLFLKKSCVNNLESCELFFPVRPGDSYSWDKDPNLRKLFKYVDVKDRELKIRVASRNANGTEKTYKLAKFVEQCINAYKSD